MREALSFLERIKVETVLKNTEIELTEEEEVLYPFSLKHKKIIMDLKAHLADNNGSNDGGGSDSHDMVTEASPSMNHQSG